MRQRIVFFLLGWVLFLQTATAQNRIVGDVLVMLKHGTAVESIIKEVQARFPQAEVALGETVAPTLNIWLFKTNPAWEFQVLDYLRGLSQVQVAQFNRIAEERLTPTDSLYPNQWNLENTGQGSGIPGADAKASQAWDLTTGGLTGTGDTIVVAIVDKGFELTHSDLVFWQNGYEIAGDSIDNDGNGYIDDVQGWHVVNENDIIPNNAHGTQCSGIVGAKTNNTSGVAGINWGLPIMPVVCTQYTESQVVAAYAYILETRRLYNATNGAKGAFVVATNSSFGIDFGLAADYPIWCAMYDSLGMQGIMSAGATANINLDVEAGGDIPSTCASDFLLVVTNTTRTDFKNPSSGYGAISVDLGAPGTGVWSTTSGNAYNASTGTSFATPHVAGAVALMFSLACPDFMQAYKQYPDVMLREIKRAILESVDVIPDLASSSTSGGRLNIYNALLRFQNRFCNSCLAINATVQQVSCFGDSTGSVSLAIDSGRSPYTYQWSNGETAPNATGLAAGAYIVTVTDSLGCSRLGFYEISQPPLLQTGYIVQRSTGTNGSITVLLEGGVPPYEITWQNNVGTDDSAIHLAPGAYGITVADQNGCTVADVVNVYLDSTVQSIAELPVISEVSFYPNPTESTLYFEMKTEAQGILEIVITDLLGRRVGGHSMVVMSNTVSGNIAMDNLPVGIYLLEVRLNGAQVHVGKVLKQ